MIQALEKTTGVPSQLIKTIRFKRSRHIYDFSGQTIGFIQVRRKMLLDKDKLSTYPKIREFCNAHFIVT